MTIRANINPNVMRSKAVAAQFQVKDDTAGTFDGYGSVFGNEDSYGDVVMPGAFERTLADLKKLGRTLPVLWQHQTATPIGNWSGLKEDETGLFGTGELWLAEAPQASIAYKGMQTKSVTGLSIGYYVRKYEIDQEAQVIRLTDVDLIEISVVTSPANDDARIETVKSKLARGEPVRKSEVERALRSFGFPAAMATEIVACGLKDRPSDSEIENSDGILSALKNFRLPT